MLILKTTDSLTFDDVLLKPGKSSVLPGDVDTASRFTKKIKLAIPLVSAAMDTVTEARMAIALAQAGGIGVIHKNLSPEAQCAEVDKVKRSESGMIVDPITLPPNAKVREAHALMRKYRISGVPIVDSTGKLVGILTNRDLRFETRMNVEVRTLMTPQPLVTVPVGTDFDKAKKLLHKHRIEKLLVVDRNDKLKGLITVKDIQKRIKYPHACKDKLGRLRVAAAVGVTDAMERTALLTKAQIDTVVVDSAHGHSKGVMETVKKLHKKYPSLEIVAGNIVTKEAARDLIRLGASALKVGIGPGSICTTRIIAGIGMPQLSAIAEVWSEAKKARVPIIADGGIKFSGDITKALAAGASSCMLGSLFAGTDESPGEMVIYQGRTYKTYRGMGSIPAMKKGGGAERYFQNYALADDQDLIAEGIEGRVAYKGGVESLLHQMVGGLRAGMGYCGCSSVAELQKKSRFVKISPAGLRESHPHDVDITKEAPNYRMK